MTIRPLMIVEAHSGDEAPFSVSVGSPPHTASFVDVRFRSFINLKGVSLWKLGTSFSQDYHEVQVAAFIFLTVLNRSEIPIRTDQV